MFFLFIDIPSGKLWKIIFFFGKTHYKWQFSIVMLNYQRVVGVINQPMDIFVFAWDVPFFFARFEARASRSQPNVAGLDGYSMPQKLDTFDLSMVNLTVVGL